MLLASVAQDILLASWLRGENTARDGWDCFARSLLFANAWLALVVAPVVVVLLVVVVVCGKLAEWRGESFFKSRAVSSVCKVRLAQRKISLTHSNRPTRFSCATLLKRTHTHNFISTLKP